MRTLRFAACAALATLAGAASAQDKNGLVGWWSFNDVKGQTAPDRSGCGNDARIMYGKLVKGVDGAALLFDDPQAWVRVPPSPSLCPTKAVSLEAWVKLSRSRQPGFASVLRKDGAYALRFGGGRIGFIIWTQGRFTILSAPKTDWRTDRWHHLAGVYDGREMRLYIDGRPAAAMPYEGAIDASFARLHMGGQAGNYRLFGAIDEAKVFARARTPEEIRADYEAGLRALAAQKSLAFKPRIVGSAGAQVFRKPKRRIAMVKPGYLWIDAEDFQDYGGWLLDTQFVHLMGSAYLIAAGVGKPVKDATAEFDLPRAGRYRIWVRAKNWIKDYAPGKFRLLVNGRPAAKVFGQAPVEKWVWESAGEFDLPKGQTRLALHDLTGYYGRCDAIVMTTDMGYTPPNDLEGVRRARARLTGLSLKPKLAGEWDVIVVGAGPAGCPAAIAAARTGARTALIQNRPVLGGNASRELGVPMNGAACCHPNARESGIAEEAGRIKARYGFPKMSGPFRLLAKKEKNLSVFLNEHVFDVVMADAKTIAAVKAVNTLTNEITLYKAKRFIDCTGDGWVGYYAKADYHLGREARSEYNESLAPEKPDKITMSGCLMGRALNYRAEDTGKPAPYTPPPWAAKLPPPDQFNRYPRSFIGGTWWMEHRGTIDDLWQAEMARDELIRIVFGYWGWIKNHSRFKEQARTYALAHIPIVEAKRESRRLIGDYVLTQNDVLAGRVFPDRISYGGWPMDVHHPLGIFSGKAGPFYCDNHVPIYTIPYRCVYSRNIENLLMAGRDMSVTHLALGTVRVQSTLATVGQAAGTAAAMSLQFGVTPRGLYQHHLRALQQQLLKDDQYIPGVRNEDPRDLARRARAAASSEKRFETIGRPAALARRSHALNMNRAMMFPRGAEKRVGTVYLWLANTGARSVTARAFLRAAARSGDFSATRDLARAQAELPPKFKGWAAFRFDAEVPGDFAWVWLPRTAGVQWRLMPSAPAGSCRAYGGTSQGGWTVVKGQYYALYTDPPIRARAADYRAGNVINGWARVIGDAPNLWASDPEQKLPQWVQLDWDQPQRFNSVYLTFDTNLNHRWCTIPFPPECVRDYVVEAYAGGRWRRVAEARNNFQRRCIHRFPRVSAAKLRVVVQATNGAPDARVFEIRVYDEPARGGR